MGSVTHPKHHNINGHSSSKDIVGGELTLGTLRRIPAQSLYLAIQSEGLESSVDLLPSLHREQYTALLDFDLWKRDEFSEKKFWEWLIAIDEDESLTPLEAFLNALDLKLLGILLARHVETIIREDNNDPPPGQGFFSPDRGFTWVKINLKDERKYQLLGKLLAFLFETNAELYYSIITNATSTTSTELEELCYQDKTKRLLNEGIPSNESSVELHSRLVPEQLATKAKAIDESRVESDMPVITPLIVSGEELEPLRTALEIIGLKLGADARMYSQQDLTYIANCALVYFSIPFHEHGAVQFLLEQVRGAINIGLQLSLKDGNQEILDVVERHDLRTFYQLGLSHLRDLRKEISDTLDATSLDAEQQIVLEHLKKPFPAIAEFLEDKEKSGSIKRTAIAFTSLAQTDRVKSHLSIGR